MMKQTMPFTDSSSLSLTSSLPVTMMPLQMILEEVNEVLNKPLIAADVTSIDSRKQTPVPMVEPTPIRREAMTVVEHIRTNEIQFSKKDPEFVNLISILSESLTSDADSTMSSFSQEFSNEQSEESTGVTCFLDDMSETVEKSMYQIKTQNVSNQRSNNNKFQKRQSEQWSEMYDELVQFRRKNGHCMVKRSSDLLLAHWIKRQRYQYRLKHDGRHSTLSEDRINALDQIDFIWDSHQESWEKRFLELQLFHATHGHCMVPSTLPENPQLAIWVKSQRRQFKRMKASGYSKSKTTLDRITRLNRLGFVWGLRNRKPLA